MMKKRTKFTSPLRRREVALGREKGKKFQISPRE